MEFNVEVGIEEKGVGKVVEAARVRGLEGVVDIGRERERAEENETAIAWATPAEGEQNDFGIEQTALRIHPGSSTEDR